MPRRRRKIRSTTMPPLLGPQRGELLRGAEWLLRAVDPTLDEAVYLLDYGDLAELGVPVRFDAAASCFRRPIGFVCGGLIHEVRPALEAAGRWRGDGFLAAFDFASFSEPLAFLGTCLHEYSHHVQMSKLVGRCVAAMGGPRAFRSTMTDARRSNGGALDLSCHSDVATESRKERRYMHDWRWLRLLIHVEHRAYLRGCWLGDLDRCGSSTTYGLQRVDRYAVALADEPQRMLDVPLAVVCDAPPPDQFAEFAAADLARADAADSSPAAATERHAAAESIAALRREGHG
jgi:hypothetical protein